MSNTCHPNSLRVTMQTNIGLPKVYHDDKPMEEMLKPEFWRNVVRKQGDDQLRTGDRLTLRQVEWEDRTRDTARRVVATAECEVVEVTTRGPKLAVLGKVHTFGQAEKGIKWNPGKKKHEVVIDGETVESFDSREEAEAFAA